MEGNQRFKQSVGVLLALMVVLANYSPQMQQLRAVPEAVNVRAGESYDLSLGWPFAVATSGEAQARASSDETLGASGEMTLEVTLLGVPIKSVEVSIAPEKMLMPGGQSIGVALDTQGVLVVGTAGVGEEDSPAQRAGLREGDIILTVDGHEVKDTQHLSELVAAKGGGMLNLTYRRGGNTRVTTLQPATDKLDGQLRLGLWVRDSTAGVGTLSFYDPQTHKYGALGHAISDIDTGVTLPVRDGSIYKSTVVGIRKGARGNPGELQGSFLREEAVLGNIRLNNNYGIYGLADAPFVNSLYPNGLPMASQAAVKTGKATILTTLDGEGVKAYEVEITRVAKQNEAAQKSMTLRVTDPVLLEKTGGIVQGMSGSPIIQDGRIVGAVTHVFVNDPTQGYGMYIEWMLEQAEKIRV
ncbi:MAG: SpoIVB peptidase [Oscillospiraceae bacterium]|jgi:stage IV sporulation protein B|nr:SpoIVB peptidase [Oscillospiraceae bacterium]